MAGHYFPTNCQIMAKMIIFINNIAIIRQIYWGIIQIFLSKKMKYIILDIGKFFFPITNLIITSSFATSSPNAPPCNIIF